MRSAAITPQFRYGTASRRKSRNKDGLPKGFPGAKLARMAMQNRIGIKVPTALTSIGGRVHIRDLTV